MVVVIFHKSVKTAVNRFYSVSNRDEKYSNYLKVKDVLYYGITKKGYIPVLKQTQKS